MKLAVPDMDSPVMQKVVELTRRSKLPLVDQEWFKIADMAGDQAVPTAIDDSEQTLPSELLIEMEAEEPPIVQV